MSDFIIKGTSVGFTLENWINDTSLFSSTLVTVMNNWADMEFSKDGGFLQDRHELIRISFGEVIFLKQLYILII